LPLTTLGQETRWAYSTPPPSPHGVLKLGFDPRVGHAMDVLSPFVSVLCHSDDSSTGSPVHVYETCEWQIMKQALGFD